MLQRLRHSHPHHLHPKTGPTTDGYHPRVEVLQAESFEALDDPLHLVVELPVGQLVHLGQDDLDVEVVLVGPSEELYVGGLEAVLEVDAEEDLREAGTYLEIFIGKAQPHLAALLVHSGKPVPRRVHHIRPLLRNPMEMQKPRRARLLRHPRNLLLLMSRPLPKHRINEGRLARVRPPHKKQLFLLDKNPLVLGDLLREEFR